MNVFEIITACTGVLSIALVAVYTLLDNRIDRLNHAIIQFESAVLQDIRELSVRIESVASAYSSNNVYAVTEVPTKTVEEIKRILGITPVIQQR